MKGLRALVATVPRVRQDDRSDGLVVVDANQPVAFATTHANNRFARDHIAATLVAIVNSADALISRVEELEAGLREALRQMEHDLNCAHLRGVFGPFARGVQGPCDCRRARLYLLLALGGGAP